MNGQKLFDRALKNPYTAAICDILDELGHRNQAMHHRLRPMDGECCTFIGRARTFRLMDIEAMDSLQAGDVAVHSTDCAGRNAPCGEPMSTIALKKGAAGCVCDSQIRDCKRIQKMGFPVYYTGIRPLDSKGRGRVVAYDVPVRCGDVPVRHGDIVFADFDGGL